MQSTKAPIQCHVLCVERVVLELQALHLLPCFHQLCLRALPRLNGADPIACTSISELQSAKSLCLACCLGQHLHRIRKPRPAPPRASFAWCSHCRFRYCGTCTCRLVRRFAGGKRKGDAGFGSAVYHRRKRRSHRGNFLVAPLESAVDSNAPVSDHRDRNFLMQISILPKNPPAWCSMLQALPSAVS